jgi:O-methyltransferase involved in polyketide biosynthesis
LAAVLARLAFEPGVPVFCSWLGVAAYLSQTAILDTLQAISRATPAGSHLVFDQIRPGVLADRAQFFTDLIAPFYGANRPGA